MWRVWLLFDPRRAFIALAVFLFTLAIFIHFILLSSDRYNWIDGAAGAGAQASISQEVETVRL
ncbi:light-harvesting antenna LH1, alpha subunit [Maricaulaceae bacterium EIL42A08]|jgi:light-harvesting complex 1 alpha chain|nr:light-harvesting antenna LH1, alpha subunit [Maricaulaceae bacterium EIL42A08]MCP2679512.1 light-harvesting antenna LH1, alpha subunit [Maricaulaceae bacterium NA33B04]